MADPQMFSREWWLSPLPATLFGIGGTVVGVFLGRLWEQLKRVRVTAKKWRLEYLGRRYQAPSGATHAEKTLTLDTSKAVSFCFKLIALNEKGKTVAFDQVEVVFARRHFLRWIRVASYVVKWSDSGWHSYHELELPPDQLLTTDVSGEIEIDHFPRLRESTRVYLVGKPLGAWLRKKWAIVDLPPWK